jgi:D-alanyl-D-alanine dipeptidase
MEDAYEFMQRLLPFPVHDRAEPLASLCQAARDAGIRIDTAPGLKMGRYPRDFRVRRALVPLLLRAADILLRQDLVLYVEDAFRDLDVQLRGARSDRVFRAVYDMAVWECEGERPSAELLLRRLSVYTAITPKSANHTAGSAVDVTLRRLDGTPLGLGGSYPELTIATPMDSPFVAPDAARNRRVLRDTLGESGFLPYPFEFWHFSNGDADAALVAGQPGPARYGPVRATGTDGRVVPVADADRPLVRLEHIQRHLDRL